MQKIIAANWKMYKTRQEARETAAAVVAALNEQPTPHEVVVFAPFTAIAEVADAFAASQAQAGAQDVWPAVEGAFTGRDLAAHAAGRRCGLGADRTFRAPSRAGRIR